MKKWQYLNISKNVVELRDNVFAFNRYSKDEIEFLDSTLSKTYSRYMPETSNEIYEMIIDVANKGTLYEMEVWNFEEAFGWIGGLIGFCYLVFDLALSPCTKHAIVNKVMSDSKVA